MCCQATFGCKPRCRMADMEELPRGNGETCKKPGCHLSRGCHMKCHHGTFHWRCCIEFHKGKWKCLRVEWLDRLTIFLLEHERSCWIFFYVWKFSGAQSEMSWISRDCEFLVKLPRVSWVWSFENSELECIVIVSTTCSKQFLDAFKLVAVCMHFKSFIFKQFELYRSFEVIFNPGARSLTCFTFSEKGFAEKNFKLFWNLRLGWGVVCQAFSSSVRI